MRIKTFVIFLLSGATLFLCIIYLGGDKRPSIESIVSETNKQFHNLKNFQDNLRDAEEKRFQAEDEHLELLGFVENPRLYPKDVWTNGSVPVILTVLFKGQEEMGVGFAKNMGHMASRLSVLIYDAGLSEYGQQIVSANCNTSKCQLVRFDLTQFPNHVQSDPNKCVRPLVIQDALNKVGAVFYVENDLRITSHLDSLLEQKPVGCFVTRQPVTTLTHPSTVDYFRTSIEGFQFLPMVEMTRLLLWNTLEVHQHVMLPWVLCVLTPECLRPIGAQSVGCRFNKKPRYRYSGCHAFDTSALNIALGLAYKFDETNYTFPMSDSFFTSAVALFNENTTTLS